MPKSSMASRTPSPCKVDKMVAVWSTSYMARLSVISRQTCDGSTPVAASTSATSTSRPGCWNWRDDRFTLTSRRTPSVSSHDVARRQACSSTKRPMGRMAPLPSASSMNCGGASMPCSGWFQRTRASAPTMC